MFSNYRPVTRSDQLPRPTSWGKTGRGNEPSSLICEACFGFFIDHITSWDVAQAPACDSAMGSAYAWL